MEKWQIVLLLVLGIVLVFLSVFLRIRTGGRYELKTTDIVLIIVPLVVVALATGKLLNLELFGVRADLSNLWGTAANAEINPQVSSVPVSPVSDAVDMVEMAPKRGVDEIPQLLSNKTEALSFQLGMGRYYAPAIREYFDKLYGSSYLKFIILNDGSGKLIGMYMASDLIAYLRALAPQSYDKFEDMLNDESPRSREWLTRIPGFLSVGDAVRPSTSKRESLATMERLKVQYLPVINQQGEFVGTVERSKLTSGLILDVTDLLMKEDRSTGN